MVREIGLLPGETVKVAAPLVEAVVKSTIDAGQTPDGVAWAPTADGKRALAGASSHVKVTGYGDVIRVVLSGVDVFHNYGPHAGKGRGHGPKRQILWYGVGDVPGPLAKALETAAIKAWNRCTCSNVSTGTK